MEGAASRVFTVIRQSFFVRPKTVSSSRPAGAQKRRAQWRSRLAAGHRRRRREAALTVASTAQHWRLSGRRAVCQPPRWAVGNDRGKSGDIDSKFRAWLATKSGLKAVSPHIRSDLRPVPGCRMQCGIKPCRSGTHLSHRNVIPREGTITTRRGRRQHRLLPPADVGCRVQAFMRAPSGTTPSLR